MKLDDSKAGKSVLLKVPKKATLPKYSVRNLKDGTLIGIKVLSTVAIARFVDILKPFGGLIVNDFFDSATFIVDDDSLLYNKDLEILNIDEELDKYLSERRILRDCLVPITSVSDATLDTLEEGDFLVGIEQYGSYYRVVGGWLRKGDKLYHDSYTLVGDIQADDEFNGTRGTLLHVMYLLRGYKNKFK